MALVNRMEATVLRVPTTSPGEFSPAVYAVIALTALSLLSAGICALIHLKLGVRYTLVTLLSFYISLGHLAFLIREVDALTSPTGPQAPYIASSYTLPCEYFTVLVSNGTSITILFWCYTFLAVVSGFPENYCTNLLGTFRVLSVVIPLVMMAVAVFIDFEYPDLHVAYAVIRDFFAFSLPIASLMVVAGAFRLLIKRRELTNRIPNAITLSVCFRFIITFLVLSVIAPFYLHDRITMVYLFPSESWLDLNKRYTNESYITGYAGLSLQGLMCFLVFGTAKIGGGQTGSTRTKTKTTATPETEEKTTSEAGVV